MECAPAFLITVIKDKTSKNSYGSHSSTQLFDQLRKSSGLIVPELLKVTGFGYHADAIINYFYNSLGLRSDIGQPPVILNHVIVVSADTLRHASSGLVYTYTYLCSISF